MGRSELIYRLFALAWLFTVGWVITLIATTIASVVAVVDMLVVLIRGKGLTKGMFSTFAVDSFNWNASQMTYIMIGDGSLELFP